MAARAKVSRTEAPLERYLVAECKRRGFLCPKAESLWPGAPDRLIVAKYEVIWVELKSPDGKLRPAQVATVKILKKLGQTVHVVRTREQVDAILGQCPV